MKQLFWWWHSPRLMIAVIEVLICISMFILLYQSYQRNKKRKSELRVIRYRPAFFGGYPPEEIVCSREELLAIPWINQWTTTEGFQKFSLNKNLLVAELKMINERGQNVQWWVVAILEGTMPDLPVAFN